ncbi:MAG: hypothetical protein HY984_02365 [Candidatus Magasanikbacteria bacterium]|nr:hypothetical protein [Candidatus Magasanikbacteria bacterium]
MAEEKNNLPDFTQMTAAHIGQALSNSLGEGGAGISPENLTKIQEAIDPILQSLLGGVDNGAPAAATPDQLAQAVDQFGGPNQTNASGGARAASPAFVEDEAGSRRGAIERPESLPGAPGPAERQNALTTADTDDAPTESSIASRRAGERREDAQLNRAGQTNEPRKGGNAPRPDIAAAGLASSNRAAEAEQPEEPTPEQTGAVDAPPFPPEAEAPPSKPPGDEQNRAVALERDRQKDRLREDQTEVDVDQLAADSGIDLTDSLNASLAGAAKKAGEAYGHELRNRIRMGEFRAFTIALGIAFVKDVCIDFFEWSGILAFFTNVFCFAVLLAIILGQGTWFKRWLIRKFFGQSISGFLKLVMGFFIENIPLADFFPTYMIAILLIKHGADQEIKKNKAALEKFYEAFGTAKAKNKPKKLAAREKPHEESAIPLAA